MDEPLTRRLNVIIALLAINSLLLFLMLSTYQKLLAAAVTVLAGLVFTDWFVASPDDQA